MCVLIGGGPFDGHSYVVEDAATSGSIFLIGSVAYIYRAIPDRPGVFVYDGWRNV